LTAEAAHDEFLVPSIGLTPVVEPEVMLHGLQRHGVVVQSQHLSRLSGSVCEVALPCRVFRTEYVDLTAFGESAFAVASTRCLRNGIDACQGPIDNRKVHVHPRLNQLGTHDSTRNTVDQPLTNLVELLGTVGGAHEGAEVNVLRGVPEGIGEIPGV